MWSTFVMSGAWASLIAVAGTLLGSVVTHVFQRRTTDRAEQLTRERQLREERLAVYGAFAGAVVNYRRGQYDRVHRRLDERDSVPHVEARAESYRLRSAAQQEFFRVQLVSDDADLTALAERALELAEQIHDAGTKRQVKEYGDRAKQALGEFVALASAKLQA